MLLCHAVASCFFTLCLFSLRRKAPPLLLANAGGVLQSMPLDLRCDLANDCLLIDPSSYCQSLNGHRSHHQHVFSLRAVHLLTFKNNNARSFLAIPRR